MGFKIMTQYCEAWEGESWDYPEKHAYEHRGSWFAWKRPARRATYKREGTLTDMLPEYWWLERLPYLRWWLEWRKA